MSHDPPILRGIRRRAIIASAAAAVGVLALVSYEAIQREGAQVSEEMLEPEAVQLLPQGNDPHVVMIGVTWMQQGWCLGQFHTKSTETTNEVIVGTVSARMDQNGICAGVGTVNNMAWAELHLKAPLGDRRVIRASDHAVLPLIPADVPPPSPGQANNECGQWSSAGGEPGGEIVQKYGEIRNCLFLRNT